MKELITVETPNVMWKVDIIGEGKPLLMMHGFPDTPESFRHQQTFFLEAGYQLIIPFLPGYGESRVKGAQYYYPGYFPQDISTLVQKLGFEKVDYIGHDWGGFAGLLFAGEHPEMVEHVVVAAIPGMKGMKQGIMKQLYRSRYMMQFQFVYLIEWLIRRDGYRKIDRLFAEWSPDTAWQEEEVGPVRTLLSQPGQLENAIGYYRAAIRKGPFDKNLQGIIEKPITVPSLIMGGRNDGCIGIECFAGQEEGFSGPFTFHVIENAGHFMHQEKPEEFNQTVLEFLKS